MSEWRDDPDLDEVASEERAIYRLVAVVTIPVVLGVLVAGGHFGSGPTISVGILVLALAGLGQLRRCNHRIPRAKVLKTMR